MHAHVCVRVCEAAWCWKNASIKPQGMEGTPHLPPTEKVKLLNINSGSGHHADYATITILHTASMDPLHPHTPHVHTLFTLPVLTRPFGIKTQPQERALSAPLADIHKHVLTQSSAITILYNGLSINPEPSETPAPHATPHSWNISWYGRSVKMHTDTHACTHTETAGGTNAIHH